MTKLSSSLQPVEAPSSPPTPLPQSGAPRVEAGVAATLRAFRDKLEALDYTTIYRLHCHELAPRFLAESLQRTLHHAPPPARALFRLFYFEECMARGEAEAVLGADLVSGLERAGLLRAATGADAVSSPYRIEIAGDTLLCACNLARRQHGVYYGEDSQFLRAMLRPRPGETVVDLCTGTGVQGLRCAQVARRVDVVDLHPAAATAARLNAALNGVEDRVSVFEGDLWDALPVDRRYDYVVCNPPLMPVVDAVQFPLFGHGGADGLKVVRRIVEALDTRLTDRGRCTLIGACTGEKGRPDIAAVAESLGPGFRGTLFVLLETPLRDWVRLIAETTALYYPDVSFQNAVLRSRTAYGEGFDQTVVYTYLLQCERSGAETGWTIADYSRVGHRSFWFVNRGAWGE